MRRFAKNSVLWITLAVFGSSAVLGLVVDRWYAATQRNAEHDRVTSLILPYANSAAAAVGRHAARMAGLKVFVESRRDAAQLEREFDPFSAGLIGNAPGIRAVQLVRDGRVARVHPLAGNENSVGLDLKHSVSANGRAGYARAVAAPGITIFGPTTLLQGGVALVIDQSVHAPYDKDVELVTLLIDMSSLLRDADLQSAPPELALQLFGKAGQLLGSHGTVVAENPVRVPVLVADGDWELVGAPAHGWDAAIAPRLVPVRLAIVAIVLLLTVLASQLADRESTLAAAVEQRTATIMGLVAERTETIRRQQVTEADLAANEERLRLALAAARMATFEVDVVNGGLTWSPEAAPMHGLPPGTSINGIGEFVAILEPGDRERVLRAHALAIREPTANAMEYRAVGRDGVVRWIGATWLSEAGADGVVRRFIGTVTDITERKNLEEQLLHSQKLEAVGSLAGGIAHDFNNLLTVILGAGQMARAAADGLPGAENVRADIDEVLTAGDRAAVLTGQLLAFSRKQVVQPRLLEVGQLVGGMSGMLQRLVGEAVSIETVLSSEPMPVFADQGQLTQVVMNLAVNARDAMPQGGTLRISLQPALVRVGRTPPAEGLEPGRYCVLSVTDTGEGIDPAVQHLIFDPFFTTKPIGQGTGLGLSTVYGIAVQLGGGVSMHSARGRGTTFDVYLPLSDRAVDAPSPRETEKEAPSGWEGRTVLVAEDEPALQRLVARALSKAGYQVLVAGDGAAALELARAHVGDIALLVSDVVMPAMGGLQLASALLGERPSTRVLFMSGYPQDVGPEGAVTLADAAFLAKPFTPRDLREAVRRALTE